METARRIAAEYNGLVSALSDETLMCIALQLLGPIDDKERVMKRARELLAQAGAADAEGKVTEAEIDELWELLRKYASR
jgi:hypothetical protein